MILLIMTALCCTVQAKANDRIDNLDTIRVETSADASETYQYLKPTYQKGGDCYISMERQLVCKYLRWNERFYGHSIGV